MTLGIRDNIGKERGLLAFTMLRTHLRPLALVAVSAGRSPRPAATAGTH
jgi:hypothetical protein